MQPLRAINENHRLFLDELFARVPFSPIDAYQATFNCDRDSARANASRLMLDPLMKAEVEKRQQDVRERAGLTAEDILRELYLLGTADPRELSEFYVGACRYCHGDAHQYQRTPAEYESDLADYLARVEKAARAGKCEPDPLGMRFPMQGGIGFNAKLDPHDDCPECFGDGIGYSKFKDTRKLSKAAARLYAGVKKTKDGLEIKTRSQDKALELAGQTLGMFKQSVEMTGKDGKPLLPQTATMTDEQLAVIAAGGALPVTS